LKFLDLLIDPNALLPVTFYSGINDLIGQSWWHDSHFRTIFGSIVSV